MAGFARARQMAILDAEFVSGDYLMFSANGTSETANLGRMAIGGWNAATNADPSVKANTNAATTPGASGAVVVSHAAIVSAAAAGTVKTDWTALAASKSLGIGDTIGFAAGAIQFSLD